MAIFSFSVKPLAAEKVGPAVAYQSRQVIRLDGETFRPSKTAGLVADGIAWPRGVGGDIVIGGRDALWSAALDAERVRKRGPRCGELRRRAVAGRTAIAALPHELTDAQRLALVRDFADALADRHRCAVDFAIHAPDPSGDQRNHHAHLAWTERAVRGDGMGAKVRAFGGKGRAEELRRIRQAWERCCNRALARAGVAARVDARTLVAQGVARSPGRHVGAAGTAEARRGAGFHRTAIELARQVRIARDLDAPEAQPCWRRLVAHCREGVRSGVAEGDALDLAKKVQAEEQFLFRKGRRRRTLSAIWRSGSVLKGVVRTMVRLTRVGAGMAAPQRRHEPTLSDLLATVAALRSPRPPAMIHRHPAARQR